MLDLFSVDTLDRTEVTHRQAAWLAHSGRAVWSAEKHGWLATGPWRELIADLPTDAALVQQVYQPTKERLLP